MIVCGWCGKATPDGLRCVACGHLDPAKPWEQRGLDPTPVEQHGAGRPRLDAADIRRRLAEAERELDGRAVTKEALAEALGVDPATVRRWRKVVG